MIQYLGMWQVRAAIAGIVILTAFTAGWEVNGWRYQSKIADQLAEQQAQKDLADRNARKLVEELQDAKASNQKLYDQLKKKVPHVTDNRVCFANWDAVWLWNQALSGTTDVPKTSAGTSSNAGGASAVTDGQILDNQIENAKRWKNLRDQVHKLRKWDKETFGDK